MTADNTRLSLQRISLEICGFTGNGLEGEDLEYFIKNSEHLQSSSRYEDALARNEVCTGSTQGLRLHGLPIRLHQSSRATDGLPMGSILLGTEGLMHCTTSCAYPPLSHLGT